MSFTLPWLFTLQLRSDFVSVTTDMKNQMNFRDQFHGRYKQTRDRPIADWRIFKNVRRSIKIALKAEKEHECAEVNLHKDNPGSLWKVINKPHPIKKQNNLVVRQKSSGSCQRFQPGFFSASGENSCRNSYTYS